MSRKGVRLHGGLAEVALEAWAHGALGILSLKARRASTSHRISITRSSVPLLATGCRFWGLAGLGLGT